MILRPTSPDRRFHRYHAEKAITYLFIGLVVVAISIVWGSFAGRVGVVLGIVAAGVAFGMQEVIGALAGWVNIVAGAHLPRGRSCRNG